MLFSPPHLLTIGKTSVFPTPGPSLIPPLSTPPSPTSILEAHPGSATKEAVILPYQTFNSTETSVNKTNTTSTAAAAFITVTGLLWGVYTIQVVLIQVSCLSLRGKGGEILKKFRFELIVVWLEALLL